MNLNQVTLPATDMAASVRFYKALGFVQIVDSAHYARFECPVGDATFSLHQVERAGDGGVLVYFEHDELDAWCERLSADGIAFLSLPEDQSWLWREARLLDPAGNPLCLYCAGENRKHPPWRI